MPAQIVVVLDEPEAAGQVVALLNAQGRDAASLADSMAALDALGGAVRIELLVTCLDHGPGQPNGISLALLARQRRPDLKLLFVGDAELAHFAAGLGTFLTTPVRSEDLVSAAVQLLEG